MASSPILSSTFLVRTPVLIFSSFTVLVCYLTPEPVLAEDLPTIFKKVEQFAQQKNFPKALEELAWAKKELEQQHLARTQSFLPDSLGGFTGEKVESNSALGLSSVERAYKKGSEEIRVAIQGGSGTSGATGFGGLAAFGQMAAMLGNQAGQNTFRVKGRTANLNDEAGELVIFLDGGSMLTIRREQGSTDLKAVAESFDLDGLENYLKG